MFTPSSKSGRVWLGSAVDGQQIFLPCLIRSTLVCLTPRAVRRAHDQRTAVFLRRCAQVHELPSITVASPLQAE